MVEVPAEDGLGNNNNGKEAVQSNLYLLLKNHRRKLLPEVLPVGFNERIAVVSRVLLMDRFTSS